ncbi:MAG: response regulator [Chlorobi bacterium]|nr:response regulator [Chlorobiota bacterium]
MKFMIVDDNELMRKAIIENVTDKNDQIIECKNGEAALLSLNDFNPDWILMDIKMKGMNGLIAAQRIKEIDPAQNIAFVTSYDYEAFRAAAKNIGVELYFMKDNLLLIREKLEEQELPYG